MQLHLKESIDWCCNRSNLFPTAYLSLLANYISKVLYIWCCVSTVSGQHCFHQNSGGIGKSIPDAREISRGKSRRRGGWISQYLPSFGGARTFSHYQSFWREWIRKSFPVKRIDNVRINPSQLMTKEWSLRYISVNCHEFNTTCGCYWQCTSTMEDSKCLKINQCLKRVESSQLLSLPIILSRWGKRFLSFHFHWLPFLPAVADHNHTALHSS